MWGWSMSWLHVHALNILFLRHGLSMSSPFPLSLALLWHITSLDVQVSEARVAAFFEPLQSDPELELQPLEIHHDQAKL